MIQYDAYRSKGEFPALRSIRTSSFSVVRGKENKTRAGDVFRIKCICSESYVHSIIVITSSQCYALEGEQRAYNINKGLLTFLLVFLR